MSALLLERAVDLAFVLVTLRRAWWLLALTAVLGLGGAAAVNATSPVKYTATVQQFVSMTDQVNLQSTGGALSGAQFALQRVKSYTQIATSSQVLQPVIDQLQLHTTVTELAGRVQATNPLDTVLIELSVTDLDPRRAAATANAISVQLGTVVQNIEAPAGGGVSPVKVTVTEQATAPTAPVSPKVTLNLALGLLVGIGLGAGTALLRAQLDTRISHIRDVEALTGRAPLGIVPFDSAAKNQPLIASDQASQRAESFRVLRTNLRFADVDHPPRVLVVTSPLPGDGKSTTACNIALTLALNGSRVVIVEGDLRKPRATSYLGLDSAVGLTNVLAGQHGLDDVLVSYQGGLLTVLPAGPIPPNPSELLGSRQLATTVRTLAAAFDHVVIDAAPLLPVTDAAVLSGTADGALVVVRHSKTTRDELQRALQTLQSANARVLGTVVNFTPSRKRGRGGGYGYGYGYGTYGGYGSVGKAAPAPPPGALSSPLSAPLSATPSSPLSATPAAVRTPSIDAGRVVGRATPGGPLPEDAGLTLLPLDGPLPATPATAPEQRPAHNGTAREPVVGPTDAAWRMNSPYTGSMKASPYAPPGPETPHPGHPAHDVQAAHNTRGTHDAAVAATAAERSPATGPASMAGPVTPAGPAGAGQGAGQGAGAGAGQGAGRGAGPGEHRVIELPDESLPSYLLDAHHPLESRGDRRSGRRG